MLERWTEYLEELLKDYRGNKPIIKKNFDGPKILKSEIESALKKIKRTRQLDPTRLLQKCLRL